MQIRAKRRQSNLAARFFLFIFAVAALLVGGLAVVITLNGRAGAAVGPGAEDLNPAERTVLLAYLTARAADLTKPAGRDATPVNFSVASGATAGQVAEELADRGLVSDARLLVSYLRYHGLDGQVEAGDFILRQTMTVPQVAQALTDANAREVLFRVIEGWRLEQVSEALAAQRGLSNASGEFASLAGPHSPRAATYDFLAELPAGASLEGYLFPDTYLFRPDATAADIIDKMLANFAARLPGNFRTDVSAQGLTLHQAVTLASLIEREAVVADERPVIASVILNRLAAGQRLEIDATTQYALGRPGDWWPRLGGLDLRAVDNPYNTYAYGGLPPGPIASPSLASLQAVAQPAETGYLYYRALCDGSGRHAFAVTYEEHLANACP
ncbi:MAG: endolytic transglycosylase MltG [Anaerolineales bacterium]|nr:endolytic transglycosylase MltG [Anaerolineales bacterium]